MFLSSGRLYWPSTVHLGQFPIEAHDRDIRCDVLVVGAGITGALAARLLVDAGATVTIIDRRQPATGSTAASTALAVYDLDEPLTDLQKRFGHELGSRAYRASFDALDAWRSLLGDRASECGWAAQPTLFVASSQDDVAELEAEHAARDALGLPVELLARATLLDRFAIERPAAILSHAGFEINPVATTLLLLRQCVERGAKVLPGVLADLSEVAGRTPMRVPLRGGPRITADWIVIATGYEAPEQFREVARLTRLKTTFALATAPLELAWCGGAMMWEHADPYIYARSTRDRRLLAGGEDGGPSDVPTPGPVLDLKARTILDKLEKLRPGRPLNAEYRWSGTFAESIDGLPFIGVHPLWKNIVFALGYGGNGITFAMVAAQIIRDLVGEKACPCADIFRVDRPLTAGGD